MSPAIKEQLLAVALRVGPHLPRRVEGEPLDQLVAVGGVDPTVDTGQRWSVSAPVSDGHRSASPGAKPSRRWAATASRWQSRPKARALPAVGRSMPKDETDGRGLARTVGPEASEHLAGGDRQVQVDQRLDVAVVLGEPGGLEQRAPPPHHHRRHGHRAQPDAPPPARQRSSGSLRQGRRRGARAAGRRRRGRRCPVRRRRSGVGREQPPLGRGARHGGRTGGVDRHRGQLHLDVADEVAGVVERARVGRSRTGTAWPGGC